VPTVLRTDLPRRPSPAVETIAYFCAAELLTNVARHAGARHAWVEVSLVWGAVRVSVTDDGHGGAVMRPGGGLSGLQDRVRTIDGEMALTSPRGGPTRVDIVLPTGS
jgi:signal transduction histidine kinase